MSQMADARPGAWRQGAGWQTTATVGSGRQRHSTTAAAPVALEVLKRGRWCVVAKVTNLDGEQILAIAHRGQRGVDSTISLPLAALDYAERAGCRWLYFRRDTTGQMWRLSLGDLRRVGWLATSGGVPEMFVKIDRLERVPWRKWEYAERTIRLDVAEKPASRQLSLI